MNGNDVASGILASGILVNIVVAIIVFLIFREIICWYWKINRNVELLTEIRDLLAGKDNSPDGVAPIAQQSPSSPDME